MRQLKSLNDTIKEVEMEIKNNPDPFLFSTLQRLKIYRDNNFDMYLVKIKDVNKKKNYLKGSF